MNENKKKEKKMRAEETYQRKKRETHFGREQGTME